MIGVQGPFQVYLTNCTGQLKARELQGFCKVSGPQGHIQEHSGNGGGGGEGGNA